MSPGRQRANGEGSIFPYRTGYAAYVWVTTSDGARRRKWAYGKTREGVHGKWLKLHAAAQRGQSRLTRRPSRVIWRTGYARSSSSPTTLR